jgi:hypothetical protein
MSHLKELAKIITAAVAHKTHKVWNEQALYPNLKTTKFV